MYEAQQNDLSVALPNQVNRGSMRSRMADGKRVLLVEDEESIAKPLVKLMKLKGYDLIWARDAFQGLEWLDQNGPVDCLFIDIMLPKMNGWEFREMQKGRKDVGHIPAIFLSADSNSAREAEMRGEIFVAKPIDLSQLERRLNEVTETKGK